MIALRDRELAEHGVVEAELVLVAIADEAEGRGRPHQAVRQRPFRLEVPLPLVGFSGLRIGVKTQHGGAEPRVDGGARARERADRRAAADVDRLAEVQLQCELVGGRLRPEAVSRARH